MANIASRIFTALQFYCKPAFFLRVLFNAICYISFTIAYVITDKFIIVHERVVNIHRCQVSGYVF